MAVDIRHHDPSTGERRRPAGADFFTYRQPLDSVRISLGQRRTAGAEELALCPVQAQDGAYAPAQFCFGHGDDQSQGFGQRGAIGDGFQDAVVILLAPPGLYLFGDVLAYRNVVADFSRVVLHRRNQKPIPVEFAILPAKAEFSAPVPALGQRLVHVAEDRVRCLPGIEECFRPAADCFGCAVAADGGEMRVDVDDPGVGVDDHDRHRALLNGYLQTHERGFDVLPRLNVPGGPAVAEEASIFVKERLPADRNPAQGLFISADLVFEIAERTMCVQVGLIGLPFFSSGELDAGEEFQSRHAKHGLLGQRELDAPAILNPSESMLRVGLPEPVGGGFGKCPEALLALLQRALRRFASGDVTGDVAGDRTEYPEHAERDRTHDHQRHDLHQAQHLRYPVFGVALVERADLLQLPDQAVGCVGNNDRNGAGIGGFSRRRRLDHGPNESQIVFRCAIDIACRSKIQGVDGRAGAELCRIRRQSRMGLFELGRRRAGHVAVLALCGHFGFAFMEHHKHGHALRQHALPPGKIENLGGLLIAGNALPAEDQRAQRQDDDCQRNRPLAAGKRTDQVAGLGSSAVHDPLSRHVSDLCLRHRHDTPI